MFCLIWENIKHIHKLIYIPHLHHLCIFILFFCIKTCDVVHFVSPLPTPEKCHQGEHRPSNWHLWQSAWLKGHAPIGMGSPGCAVSGCLFSFPLLFMSSEFSALFGRWNSARLLSFKGISVAAVIGQVGSKSHYIMTILFTETEIHFMRTIDNLV